MTTQQQSALVNTGPARIAVSGEQHERFDEILTPAALDFLLQLNQRFTPNLKDLLDARVARQADIDSGELPGFREDTRHIREAEWWVAEIPAELRDRRVEITGPAERKMMINALNSGACVFMADIEDSLSPTWHNVIQAQVNLKDAVNGCIEYTNLEGKTYRLEEDTAVLIVRPRGLHLPEKHILADDEPLPGALVDFGLFFFHNARALVDKKSGPYFYIPKLETAEEAEWWADVFQFAEEYLELPHGTIKATVLIETILAAFEMDEILYAMREYIIGLNCGRWDYIFSFIKKFHKHPEFILPDRNAVTMTRHFLRSYSRLLIKTCHRRGAYAMGGMAAQIPIKHDRAANEEALNKVREDKRREVKDGHDGTWVAHPGLIQPVFAVFNHYLKGTNQLERSLEHVDVSAEDLLQVPQGVITRAGVTGNVKAALRYIASWLDGNGCVPLNNLMEDAATAEIARAQLWQWIHHANVTLDDGGAIDEKLFITVLQDVLDDLRETGGDPAFAAGRFTEAAELLKQLVLAEEFTDFLTLPAYSLL